MRALSARLLEREASPDEGVELGHGELVQAVGRAVDEALLDQAGAGGSDAFGAGATELGGDLARAVGARAEVRHRGEVGELGLRGAADPDAEEALVELELDDVVCALDVAHG